MAKTNQQIVEDFLDGNSARGESLWTDGSRLMSYSYPLAWHYYNELGRVRYNIAETGIKLQTRPSRSHRRPRVYDAAYSPTTNRHRRLLLQVMDERGFDTLHAEPMDRDTYEYRLKRGVAAQYGRGPDGVYPGDIDEGGN